MVRLGLTGGKARHAQGLVVDGTFPTVAVEAVPVHSYRTQGCGIVTVHQLLDETWSAHIAQLETDDGIDEMFPLDSEAMVEVELVAQGLVIGVVGLLEPSSSVGEEAFAIGADHRVVGETHQVGVGLVVELAAAL